MPRSLWSVKTAAMMDDRLSGPVCWRIVPLKHNYLSDFCSIFRPAVSLNVKHDGKLDSVKAILLMGDGLPRS